MKKSISKSIVAAALSLPVMAFAGTLPITFDTNGGLPGGAFTVDLLDWAPGNALAVGGNPSAGLTPGSVFQLLYQANLTGASLNGNNVVAPGINTAQRFTIVAGVQEVVVANGSGSAQFSMFSAPVASATNFFNIYANALGGDNLTGLGFTAGSLIMSGHIASISSSGYNTLGLPPSALDNFGANNYPGILSIIGSGSTDVNVKIDMVDALYFPTLTGGNVFSFTNTSQVTPFNQVNPSALFSSNGVANGDVLANIGPVNGQTQNVNYNFQFQADGNSSFTNSVPEPGSLALLGLALGFAGVASRRSNKKA